MPRKSAKQPTGASLYMKLERERLGWTQIQLAEEVKQHTGFPISVSTIKQYEEGGKNPSENTTQRVKTALKYGRMGSIREDRQTNNAVNIEVMWMDNYNLVTTNQRVHDALANGLAKSHYSYSPVFFTSNAYSFRNENQQRGLQAELIDSRRKMISSIINEITKIHEQDTGLDVISLSVGYGWLEIDIAIKLAQALSGKRTRLSILSNSFLVIDRAMTLLRNAIIGNQLALRTIFGYHETLHDYREDLFNPECQRIILLIGYLINHEADITLLDSITSFCRRGDLLLLDICTPLGSPEDPSSIRKNDVRINGTLDTSLSDSAVEAYIYGLTEFQKTCSNSGSGKILSKDLTVGIEIPDRRISTAQYGITVEASLEFQGQPKLIPGVYFFRHDPDYLTDFLSLRHWRLCNSFSCGYDTNPRYPMRIMLFCKY